MNSKYSFFTTNHKQHLNNVNIPIATAEYISELEVLLHFRFQELDLSAEALVFNDSHREDSWLKAIENGLPKSAHYYKVCYWVHTVFSQDLGWVYASLFKR